MPFSRVVSVRTFASNSYSTSGIRVPVESASKNPLCIHCKYYLPPNIHGLNITDKKRGYCEKSGMMHLVDGSVEYEQAERYREYVCKGTYYERMIEEPLEPSSEEVLYS